MLKKRFLIIGILLILVAIPLTVYLLNGSLDFRKKADDLKATFAFDPPSGTIANGNDFPINITIDTGDKDIVGADLVILFDPTLVSVVDNDPTKAGLQISSGKFFDNPLVLANKVDGNKIYLSINSFTPFKGRDLFGTVTFHAKKAGQLKLSFDPSLTKITQQGTALNIFSNSGAATFTIDGLPGSIEATPEATPKTSVDIDLNHDGQVNELDLQIFSKKMGSTQDIAAMDFNGDGKVDKADQQIFMAQYRSSASQTSALH